MMESDDPCDAPKYRRAAERHVTGRSTGLVRPGEDTPVVPTGFSLVAIETTPDGSVEGTVVLARGDLQFSELRGRGLAARRTGHSEG